MRSKKSPVPLAPVKSSPLPAFFLIWIKAVSQQKLENSASIDLNVETTI
jgi:hypothetical protein